MLGIGFIKAPPTNYVIHFKNGRVARKGPGAVVLLLLAHVDDRLRPAGQRRRAVRLQGGDGRLPGRHAPGAAHLSRDRAAAAAALLDFSVNWRGAYESDDPEKLKERLVNATQVLASAVAHRLPLRQVLVAYDALVAEVLAGLRAAEPAPMLGVEIISLSVTAITPTPETGKALEAEAREQILRRSDEAVYARRNAERQRPRGCGEALHSLSSRGESYDPGDLGVEWLFHPEIPRSPRLPRDDMRQA